MEKSVRTINVNQLQVALKKSTRRESKSPFLGTFTFLGVTSSAMEQYILQYIVGVFTIIIIYIVVPANNNIY